MKKEKTTEKERRKLTRQGERRANEERRKENG